MMHNANVRKKYVSDIMYSLSTQHTANSLCIVY